MSLLTPEQHEKIARDYFEVKQVSGDELICLCPFHGDTSPSLWFNVKTGLWYCFACHEKGNYKRLTTSPPVTSEDDEVRALLAALDAAEERSCRCSERYAQIRESRLIPEDLNVDNENVVRATLAGRSRRALPVVTKSVHLPGVCEVCNRPFILDEDYLTTFTTSSEKTFDYWTTTRDLHEETVTTFGLGYDVLRRSATIPVRTHDGLLLGVIRRVMDGKPKYRNPKKFKKSEHLFGSHLLTSPRWVVLCEGPVDTMKVHQAGMPAVGMYGSDLSRQQVRLLRYLGVEGVVVFTDAEKEGRAAAELACERLGEADFPVRSVDWGRRRRGDPGGLEEGVIRALVHKSAWVNPSR